MTPRLGISKDPYETLLVVTCDPWTKKEMAKPAVVMYVELGVLGLFDYSDRSN